MRKSFKKWLHDRDPGESARCLPGVAYSREIGSALYDTPPGEMDSLGYHTTVDSGKFGQWPRQVRLTKKMVVKNLVELAL